MAQALGPESHVYEGFWINWTNGRIQGLTLTLAPQNANLLISALALFVTMSGGQLWTIIRFTLHQARAFPIVPTPDMLYNQQQLILRNITTDLATAQLLAQVAWKSRTKAVKLFTSSMVMISIAVIHAVLFLIAGTFSSSVVTTDSTVLTRSTHCGVLNSTYFEIAGLGVNAATAETFALSVEYIQNKEHDVQVSLEYAWECYMSPDLNYTSSSCKTFQRPRLYWKMLPNGTCPFEAGTCSEKSETIVFDTGLIDSHLDLGINGNYNDRLAYRRVTNCTVLNDTAHVTNWINQTDGTDGQPSLELAYANYGPSLQKIDLNYTYAVSNFADFYTEFTAFITNSYQLNTQVALGEASNPNYRSQSTFAPRPEIKQSKADLLLFFLSYSGKYLVPIEDPWFSAHQLGHANSLAPLARSFYRRDKPISTLACTEQHQICDSSGTCTDLLGFDQVQEAVLTTFTSFTPNQAALMDRITRSVAASSMGVIVETLASSSTSLLAISSAVTESTTLSVGLPSNQWQAEAGFWHSVAMAHLQRTFVEYGNGKLAAQAKYILPPKTAGDRWICDNLMIRGTEFQSFSVLALSLIAAFGALVILVSLDIETLGGWIQSWSSSELRSSRRKIWDDHDLLGPNISRSEPQRQSSIEDDSFRKEAQRSCRIGDKGMFIDTKTNLRSSCATSVERFELADTPKDGDPISSCATCRATETLTWHSSRLGPGWWCDACFRRYQKYMEVRTAENSVWI